MRSLWLCEEKNRPLGEVMSPLYRDKYEKEKSLKECEKNFRFFRLMFLNKALFQMQNLFSAYPRGS